MPIASGLAVVVGVLVGLRQYWIEGRTLTEGRDELSCGQ